MQLFIYILLFSFFARIILSVLFSNPVLFYAIIIGTILYNLYRNKKQMQAYTNYQRSQSSQEYRTYEQGSTTSNKDIFDAEYTEQEVH